LRFTRGPIPFCVGPSMTTRKKSDTHVSTIRHADPERRRIITMKHVDDDARLSWKSVGILTYLLTRPDGWLIYRGDLVNRHADGRDSVKAGLKELREAGYLEMKPQPRGGWEWTVHTFPKDGLSAFGTNTSTAGNSADGKPGRLGGEYVKGRKKQRKKGKAGSGNGELFHGLPAVTEDEKAAALVRVARFDDLWAIHPRGTKHKAVDFYLAAVPAQITHEDIVQDLRAYVGRFRGDFRGAALWRWIRDKNWEEQQALRGGAGAEVGSPGWAEAEAKRIAAADVSQKPEAELGY